MGFGRRKDKASRPWRLSAKLLIMSSVATVIGFSAICASVLIDMRRGEEELARQTLENLASGIDTDISRNVELFDLSLRAVASNMVAPEISQVSKPIRQLILFDHAAAAKHFGAIQVFDADGKLIVDASAMDPAAENRSDEEYFKVHRPLGTITVFRRDGTIIMRTPFDLDAIGRNLGYLPGIKRMLSEPSGSYSGNAASDHVYRLYVWRDGTRPLVVLVGKPWDDILSLWRTEATRIGAIMLALISFVLGVTLFLAREIGRRAIAEEKLEELATTDALTGLKNRRKFDTVIDAEWRRAARQKMPLALLMIDADYFKTYNDTFGHQAGDEVLIGIGICITDAVRRAGDCAARYGGEEFAVLLPGLSSMDAFEVAETIRLKVQQWSGEPPVTTVSIGVASLTPDIAMEWSGLVNAADRALYAAKANGRNRSVLANIPKLSLAA
jgi:diguanylate cyclase (GGDEF)-like protein